MNEIPMPNNEARVEQPVPAMHTRILRLPEVINRVGLRRASIYAAISAGTFPRQVPLGARAVGWIENDIEAWLEARIQKSRDSVHSRD